MDLVIRLSHYNTLRHEETAARLGNILDEWGTFWTTIYVVLSYCEVCQKLCNFNTVFKGKIGTLSPKKAFSTHF